MAHPGKQSGQVLVIVAVWMLALIGSAALILLAGSVEWQRNQLQQIADQAGLDAAMKIGVSCSGASAGTVITEADNFIATQRTRTGVLSISGASCSAGYTGTDTFSTGVTETIHYPYRSHQQQVEVILTEALPISFGGYLGASNTNVTRRAVAMQLSGSTAALTANTLSCTGGQFNVAGSVVTSNAISLSGGCAVYAHQRLDVASTTYSDLGNASVYAGGQTWVGGGGACVAGANAGSRNAVCADGYELTGHTAMTCGTSGTSAYLTAGNSTINPNPCAAGTGALPVVPLSTNLPPEPNSDPSALATLPGSTPCNPAAVYGNLVVGGATIGTAEAGTPAPTKDGSNYYHLKPSCYGYLNPSLLPAGGGSITNRQIGRKFGPARKDVIPALPVASTAGTLLVVTIWSELNGAQKAFSPPNANWKEVGAGAFLAGTVHVDIWYYPNNPGGILNADFGVSPASINAEAQMTEWNGVLAAAPLDTSGSVTISIPTKTPTVSTAANLSQANELVITEFGFATGGPGNVYTAGAGWTGLVNDAANGYASDYRTGLPAGARASETPSYTNDSTWAGVIAAFKPSGAGGAVAGAVLDPGFYYFNGSGFPGGGGICLAGTTLLARDVTLEFVNGAGFSTGTCAAGGGAGCALVTCQFGSSAPADGTFTYFSSPCSLAPAGNASCPGSAWCPVGDRACWNLLIWAPSSVTGQIAIKGAGAKHWLLGSVFWPGTCTDTVNGTSTLDGTILCTTLSVSAGAGAGLAVGSDYGISTALVEAVLVE